MQERGRGDLGCAAPERVPWVGSRGPGRGVPRALPVDPWSCREERESWIRAKYEQLLFLAPLGTSEEPLGCQLWAAVQAQDVAAVLLLLAHARHGPLDTSPEDPQLRSPLHLAAELAHVVITQLLLWVRERGDGKGVSEGSVWQTARRGRARGPQRDPGSGPGDPGEPAGGDWPRGRSVTRPSPPLSTAPTCPPATRRAARRCSTPARLAASCAPTSSSSTAARVRAAAQPPPPARPPPPALPPRPAPVAGAAPPAWAEPTPPSRWYSCAAGETPPTPPRAGHDHTGWTAGQMHPLTSPIRTPSHGSTSYPPPKRAQPPRLPEDTNSPPSPQRGMETPS